MVKMDVGEVGMRIGLLQCDHIEDRFAGVSEDYPALFAARFGQFGAAYGTPHWRVYDLPAGQFPSSIDEFDLCLITGSRASVYEDLPWVAQLLDWIRRLWQAQIPTAGICFGHQAIAQALGGQVEKAETGWGGGVHRLTVTHSEAWMEPFQPSLDLLYLHQDQVVRLPQGAASLGRTDHCREAFYRIGKTMLGLQAHPELSPAYLATVLADRRERMGEQVVEEALASLSRPTDACVVARWIDRYLLSSASAVDASSSSLSPRAFR
jgi:GMP synthase-like glutamine amidotransferase